MSLATLFRKKPIAEIQRDAELGFGGEHGPVSSGAATCGARWG